MPDPSPAAELAVVGASYRELDTEGRARLVAMDDGPDSPVAALLAGGHARAVARIVSCSRVEWAIAAKNPGWAACLLEAACLRRGGAPMVHHYEHEAAARYLFEVAVGLDSAVEGESAIGRQVIGSFISTHEHDPLDPTLRRVWHAISSAVSEKRRVLQVLHPSRRSTDEAGVERLVVDCAVERGIHDQVVVFGRGDIGQAICSALAERDITCDPPYGRDTLRAFLAKLPAARCVVVASGAHEAWLDLPGRADGPLCIDVGSPAQVRARGGFELLTLDHLLARSIATLTVQTRQALQAIVDATVVAYCEPETIASRAQVLAELNQHKTHLMQERLPQLLGSVSDPALAKRLRAELNRFSHEVIVSVRKGGSL